MELTPGTFWKQDDYTVEIVTKSHPEYKQWRAKSGYDKMGEVVYIYRRGSGSESNKIGSFRHKNSFLQVWNGPYISK